MNSTKPFTVLAALAVTVSLVLAGCARTDRHQDIPAHARPVSSGDRQLSYDAPKDGTVYVYDLTRDRMVYSGKVEEGQMIVVDPDADRVTVDGTVAFEDGINRGSTHRIFFQPSEDPAEAVPAADQETERERVRVRIEEYDEPQPDRVRVRVEEREVERVDEDE